jgi:TnpA family transposase
MMSADLLATRRFKALQGDWPSEELGRFFWLTPNDMLQVRTCRGAANRLGFALNLLLLNLLHCPLPSLEVVPERIVQFVAMQLNTHPDILAEYSTRRKQTRDEHLVQIRTHLGVRLYVPETDGPRLAEYLLERALQRDDPAVLLEEAEDWLRQEHMLYPAENTIQRIISQVRPQAETEIFATITRQLTASHVTALDDLLRRTEGKRGSTLAWLKDPPVQASPASMKNLLKKLNTIRDTGILAIDLSLLNRNRVRVLANLGRKYHRDSLERFSPQKRQALLVCCLQDLYQDVLDQILTSFQDLLTAIFRRTERKENQQHMKHGRTLTRHVHAMRKAVKVILDTEVPDDQVRATVFTTIPRVQLQAAYDDSGVIARPEDGQAFDLLEKHYSFLRKFLPQILTALTFTGTQAAQPVVQGIAALMQMDEEGRRKLPAGTPMAFVPEDWRAAIDRSDGVVGKHLWELCLAQQMGRLLRSSDLHIPGSRQHKVWTAYLHAPAAWAARKVSWFARWHGAPDPDTYLDALEDRYLAVLKTVQEGWETNDFASIGKDDEGKPALALSKDEKVPTPETVAPLREAVIQLLPHARLADVFIEVDDWVGLRQHFTHLNERKPAAQRDARVDTALFAALLAHGLNLPLTTMAEATEIPYHELTHVSDWYLREETIRHAIVALVDYHHSLSLSAAFGPGTMAMSDGIRFEVSSKVLHAQYDARHFGPRRGVTLHDMTSDQYSHPYVQIITPHMREAHAALDALLHHETELPLREMMVDTAGFTDLMYALYEAEGFYLSPRIRDLPSLRLFPLERAVDYGVLTPLFHNPALHRDPIKRCWDDMHRVAASLKDGTVTTVLLSDKLQALDRKNLVHRGLEEWGRWLRTMDILTFISDPAYRHRVGRMLNKGESVHKLAREIAYGQQGVFTDHDFASHLNRATCLSLLINIIAVWNTRYMQAALDHLRAIDYPVQESDVEHLSPILSAHINLHGSHHFDFQAPRKRQGQLRPLRIGDPL